MPTVVQWGAGAIGRGFMGQLWSEAGYEVVFVDVDPALVARLNERGAYPLRLLPPDGSPAQTRMVGPVRAVDGSNTDAVAREVAGCAWACTAVGVGIFPRLAPVVAAGVGARQRAGNCAPLNIICCENQAGAGAILRVAVEAALPDDPEGQAYFAQSVGFVDASVGRMVPPPTPELLQADPLLVAAEPYAALPVDAGAWRGDFPSVPGLEGHQNFAAHVARKLFTHNGGHAALAYHGYRAGHEFIYQAVGDPVIVRELHGFWAETGAALVRQYGFDPAEQSRHETDLLRRFANRALGDTVLRVGRDPLRKLRAGDRLAGAAQLCFDQTGAAPPFVCRTLAAALRFNPLDDPTAADVQAALREYGVARTTQTLCGFAPASPLVEAVRAAYNRAAD